MRAPAGSSACASAWLARALAALIGSSVPTLALADAWGGFEGRSRSGDSISIDRFDATEQPSPADRQRHTLLANIRINGELAFRDQQCTYEVRWRKKRKPRVRGRRVFV